MARAGTGTSLPWQELWSSSVVTVTALGDGAGASNIIFHSPSVPRTLEGLAAAWGHGASSARAVTGCCPCPGLIVPGQGWVQPRGSSAGPGTAAPALGSPSCCPRPGRAEGKIYRLSEPGPEVSRGHKVHFSEVTVHFFQSNEAIICESGRFAGSSLEGEQGTGAGSERTGRSPLPFRICHSTGPENKHSTHRNMAQAAAGTPGQGGMQREGPGSAVVGDVAA